jgi:fructose-bisphosphate aldolase, class II
VLHGTHGVSNELFHAARKQGMVKINLNRTVRDEYTNFVTENAGKLELTILKTKAVEVYAKSISRAMNEILESAGKA